MYLLLRCLLRDSSVSSISGGDGPCRLLEFIHSCDSATVALTDASVLELRQLDVLSAVQQARLPNRYLLAVA